MCCVNQVSVNAIQASRYAQERVAATKHRLEKTYGRGLVSLFDENGIPTHKALRANNHRAQGTFVDLYKLGPIDAESAKSAFLGFAKGLQYNAMH